MTGLDDWAAGYSVPDSRRRARNRAAAAHAAWYALLLVLMFTTEGPEPPLGSAAWSGPANMVAVALAVTVQGTLLAAWWRAGAGRGAAPGRRVTARRVAGACG